MFALQSTYEENKDKAEHYLNLGREIAHTCHESYIRSGGEGKLQKEVNVFLSDTHLGPESFRFTNEFEAKALSAREQM